MSCHFLLREMVLTQGWNPCLLRLLHWQEGSLPLYHLGIPGLPVCDPLPLTCPETWPRARTRPLGCITSQRTLGLALRFALESGPLAGFDDTVWEAQVTRN